MIRVIHLGVGGRGRHWLDFVVDHPDCTSVACVDPDAPTLDAARGVGGLESSKFLASFDQAIQEVSADAVLIASPSFLHGQHVHQALDAGFAVMVEKPFSVDLDEALTLAGFQVTVGNKPSKLVYGYILVAFAAVGVGVLLVRPEQL